MRLWRNIKGLGGKYMVVRRGATVSAWPHFVLGARDPCAPAALMAYAHAAANLHLDPDYVADIRTLALDFTAYQAEHGRGDPDRGPAREDVAGVIRAMREVQCIVVEPDEDNRNA